MKALYDIFLGSQGVTTDSRAIRPGTMFFALRGGNFDANRFAAAALERGASYAVVDDPRIALTDRYLVVDNVLLTLQHLASYHRRQIGIKILAITGTNGKTTTKELVARVLSSRYTVAATQGNLNNHIGVPLTLLGMKAGDFGVVEMGASARGEIRALCEIAVPDYGLITNVGRAHLEGFGGPEGVKAAKGELYDYLAAHGGTAFVNTEDPVLTDMTAAHEDMALVRYSASDAREVPTHLSGGYNNANVAAAMAVGAYFGVGAKEIMMAVEGYVPQNSRSQMIETARNTVIMDCYNANPSSMRAALEDFAAQKSENPKTVILGEMKELGTYSAAEHETVLKILAGSDIREIYLVGGAFVEAARDFPAIGGMDVKTFPDTSSLSEFLSANPLTGRYILLKGSRSVGLERVAELL